MTLGATSEAVWRRQGRHAKISRHDALMLRVIRRVHYKLLGYYFITVFLLHVKKTTYLETKEEAGQQQCCPAPALTCLLVLLVLRRRCPLV